MQQPTSNSPHALLSRQHNAGATYGRVDRKLVNELQSLAPISSTACGAPDQSGKLLQVSGEIADVLKYQANERFKTGKYSLRRLRRILLDYSSIVS
jgi:hypothetical protein